LIPVLQIVVNAASSVLAAWLAVCWSVKRFRSEKWWELQSETYKRLLEGLAIIRHYVEESLNHYLYPSDMVGPNQVLVEQVPQATAEVQKAAAAGALYISEGASDALNEFVKTWRMDSGVQEDELKGLLAAVSKCLTTVRGEARRAGLEATGDAGGSMRSWRTLLLRAIGAGMGIGLAVSAVIGLSMWYAWRPKPPKPWNVQAITAEYDRIRPEDGNKTLRFYFILLNNTEHDYRVDSDAGIQIAAKLKDVKALSGFADHYIAAEYPIFVPAKGRVRFSLKIPYEYPVKEKDNETDEERSQRLSEVASYVSQKWSNLGGFAFFDSSERYEIDFPSGWEHGTKDAAGKK
jgi:hypothetical protein